jgi:ABC-type multidrug transport system ATPase subunit
LGSLSKEKTIILSTHIVSDVDALADYVVMMKDGQTKEFNMQKQKINLEEVYMKFYD